MKKKVIIISLIILTVFSFAFAQGKEEQLLSLTRENTITIYSTNDSHGRIDEKVSGPWDGPIGISKIAALKENTPNSILVDAGDTIHGTPFAILSEGIAIIDMYNIANYDFMAIGNHEFNYGYEELLVCRDNASFPIASSNIQNKKGEYDFDELLIKDIDGIKIGFFALTTEDTPETAMPANVKGIKFLDVIYVAKQKVAELKQKGADVIVAVGHLGSAESGAGTISKQLIKEVEGIDVFIDGHSHSLCNEMINKTLLVQSGQYEQQVGKIEIKMKGKNIVSMNAELLKAEDIDSIKFSPSALEKKTEVEKKLNEELAQFDITLKENVAEIGTDLSADRAPGVRTQQTDIGYLVSESYRTALDAEIAIANGGDIRASFSKGPITYGNIITTLPYFNALLAKELTPKQLKEVLENGVSKIMLKTDGAIDLENSQNGRFPQIAGFSFKYDAEKPVGERIVEIKIDGEKEPLYLNDEERKIIFAASEYIMTGGDGYSTLVDIPEYKVYGFTAEQALIEYLEKNKVDNAYFAKNNVDRITLL